MDRRSFLNSAGAASLLAYVSSAVPAFAKTVAPGSADAQLAAALDEVFNDLIDHSPELATMLGLDKGPKAALRSKLSDLSAAERDRNVRDTKKQLAKLDAIDPGALSPNARLHRECIAYLARNIVEGGERFAYGDNGYGYTPFVISQQNGAYSSVPDFLDSQHVVKTKEDADAYVARLDAFAVQLDQNSERQRADAAIGVMAPNFCLDTVLGQLRALRDKPATQTVLVESIARRTKEAGIAGDYAAQAERIVNTRVFPALDRQIALITELRGKSTDRAGVWGLPDGDAYYAAAVKASTTTNMTPEDVHQMGLQQVAEITGKLDAILKAQGMTQGSVGDRLTALNKDPKQLYPNTDEGRKQLLVDLNTQMKALDAKLPQAFATLPKAKCEIVRVPEFIQDGAPNGYYMSAALDGSRPALYYINLKDTHDWPRYSLPSLTYHEANPGHHLQISLSQEAKDLPMLLKLSPFGAYTEGWALYAEQLAQEMGAYEGDPIGEAGYLQSLLFRATRLVVDSGIHYKRWTRAQATDYMVATTAFARPRTQREIDRYCVSPGQASSYKVGHAVWEKSRADAKATLGAKFDLKQFHQILLKGAMPLTILETAVADWAKSVKA